VGQGALRSPGALRAALDPGLLHLRDDAGVGLGDVGGLAKAPPIDGEHVVFDSWSIATYLEDRYPDRASLFPTVALEPPLLGGG